MLHSVQRKWALNRVALDAGRGAVEQGPDVLVAGEIEPAGAGRVEPPADAAHGVHLEALGDLRLVPDEAP